MNLGTCFIFIACGLVIYWLCRIFLPLFLDEEKHPILAAPIQPGEVTWGSFAASMFAFMLYVITFFLGLQK